MSIIKLNAVRPLVSNVVVSILFCGMASVSIAQEAPATNIGSSDDAFAAMLESMSPAMLENDLDNTADGAAILQLTDGNCVQANNQNSATEMGVAADKTYVMITECFEAEIETSLVATTDLNNG